MVINKGLLNECVVVLDLFKLYTKYASVKYVMLVMFNIYDV